MSKKIYGWEKDGKFILSLFKKEDGRPANKYESKSEAIQEAEARGLSIEWLQ